jgi:hypothetical protein
MATTVFYLDPDPIVVTPGAAIGLSLLFLLALVIVPFAGLILLARKVAFKLNPDYHQRFKAHLKKLDDNDPASWIYDL